MNKIKQMLGVLGVISSVSAFALFGLGDSKTTGEVSLLPQVNEKSADECVIPAFAKAIGHEDQWLLHNGCPARVAGIDTEAKNQAE